jgi:hypothetical protein
MVTNSILVVPALTIHWTDSRGFNVSDRVSERPRSSAYRRTKLPYARGGSTSTDQRQPWLTSSGRRSTWLAGADP